MKCSFMPGDRLVCVDASASRTHGQPPLVEREIYICRDLYLNSLGSVGVRLEEIIIPKKHLNGEELGFRPERFEKLKDLRVFHQLCVQVPKQKTKENVE